jgi:hypothetical protein
MTPKPSILKLNHTGKGIQVIILKAEKGTVWLADGPASDKRGMHHGQNNG